MVKKKANCYTQGYISNASTVGVSYLDPHHFLQSTQKQQVNNKLIGIEVNMYAISTLEPQTCLGSQMSSAGKN